MDIVSILSAAGIGGIVGSLLTTVTQAYFSHRSNLSNRSFQEKKEVYVGYLNALHESEIQKNPPAALGCGLWKNRCELVASREVIAALEKISETNPIGENVHPNRPEAMRELKEAMRRDLGIQSIS